MCEQLIPGKAAPGTRLPFTPIQALMAATFREYIKISLAVSLRSRAQAVEVFFLELRWPIAVALSFGTTGSL